MSNISDAPSLRPVTLKACMYPSAPCPWYTTNLSRKTYPRNASQDETDATEDDDSDKRQADLPRDEGNFLCAKLYRRKERQCVG